MIEMVRVNSMFSIDHEIRAKFQQTVGYGNMSNDIEEYMKSVVEEAMKRQDEKTDGKKKKSATRNTTLMSNQQAEMKRDQ